MPDIQSALKSALSKTLQQWDDDDDTPSVPMPTTINNSLSAPSQNIQGIPMTRTTGQPHRFGVTNNVSRETFNYVRDNPGSTRKEIIEGLAYKGFAEKSTSSLLSQMVKQKMVHITSNLYYADIPEYTPIKTYKPVQKEKKILAEAIKPKRKYTKRSEGIGALLQAKIESATVPVATPPLERKPFLTKLVRTQSPESIIENMNVLQARELYDYLRKIFGG